MGRRPLAKFRKSNANITSKWIEALAPVILADGFSGKSMNEIVRIAGVSKATFYKYFNSREKLIDAVIDYQLEQVGESRAALENNCKSLPERYLEATRIAGTAVAAISNPFLKDLEHQYPHLSGKMELFRVEAVEWLRSFYEEAREAGFIRDLDLRILLIADLAVFREISRIEVLKGMNLSLGEAFLSYIEFRTRAILSSCDDADHVIQTLRDGGIDYPVAHLFA